MTEPRYDTFTFKVNKDERRLIEGLARTLERSQSDVLRLLVREAARAQGVQTSELARRGLAAATTILGQDGAPAKMAQ